MQIDAGEAVLFKFGSGNEGEATGDRRRAHFARTSSHVLSYTI